MLWVNDSLCTYAVPLWPYVNFSNVSVCHLSKVAVMAVQTSLDPAGTLLRQPESESLAAGAKPADVHTSGRLNCSFLTSSTMT